MVKLKRCGLLILILLLYRSCITPIEPESIAFDDLLVVEGLFTTNTTRHFVKLSRTSKINSIESRPVSDATIEIEADGQFAVNFTEDKPGHYITSFPYFASPGVSYVLKITTADGRKYESTAVQVVEVPPIDTVYTEFIPDPIASTNVNLRDEGIFNIFFDVKNNTTTTRAFRYLWSDVFKIKVPNPSRWKWLGGDQFEFRNEDVPELQQEYCFRHDSSSSIILSESLSSNGEIIKSPIHSFKSNHQLNIRYSFEVVQYGLSDEAEMYWKALAASSQSQGSLFDIQPGTILGNIKSVTNPDETVLGIFEATEEQRYRVFYIASDFFDQGYRTYTDLWFECDQELVIVAQNEAGAYIKEHFDNSELLYYISEGGGAVFGIRRCALCTLYGTNEEPSYWID